MQPITAHQAKITGLTLAIGALGAAIAWALAVPAAFLIGSALAVTLASALGTRLEIAVSARNLFLVTLGLGIGAGFDASASAAILRWPLAFVVQAAMLVAALFLGRWILQRWFQFDRQSAVLAVVPGHLSLVIGLAGDSGLDVARVILVQTLRLLSLIVLVPFIAQAIGYELEAGVFPAGTPMAWTHLCVLAALGVALSLGLGRVGLPAPMLLGTMIVSGAGHMSGLTPGAVPNWLFSLAFVGMGAMIGARFSGLPWATVRSGLLAGAVSTGVAIVLTIMAAIPVAISLGMSSAQVLTAFAPGGLETMIALGVAMGASPGFVAACHVMRLLVLSALLPFFLRPRKIGESTGL